MADSYESLRLTVDLTDNASNKLAAIKREIQEIGGAASGGGFDRLRRESEELRGRITPLAAEAGKLGVGTAGLARGF